MANNTNSTKNYVKYGIVAAVVIAVAILGIFLIGGVGGKNISADQAISEVSSDAASGADLRMAVVRMDAIQTQSKVLQDLRKQKESYENKLRDELTKQQKALEKEKAIQRAMLEIRQKYGKNAVVKGLNMLKGATAMERNMQIGGHRA